MSFSSDLKLFACLRGWKPTILLSVSCYDGWACSPQLADLCCITERGDKGLILEKGGFFQKDAESRCLVQLYFVPFNLGHCAQAEVFTSLFQAQGKIWLCMPTCPGGCATPTFIQMCLLSQVYLDQSLHFPKGSLLSLHFENPVQGDLPHPFYLVNIS